MIAITNPWVDLAMILMIVANVLLIVGFVLSVRKVDKMSDALTGIAIIIIIFVFAVQLISLLSFALNMTADGFIFRLQVITTILFATINAISWFLTQPKDARKRKFD